MKNIDYNEFSSKMEKALSVYESPHRMSRSENIDVNTVIERAKNTVIDLIVMQSKTGNRNVFDKVFEVSLEHCKRFSPDDNINIQMFTDMMLKFEWFFNSFILPTEKIPCFSRGECVKRT